MGPLTFKPPQLSYGIQYLKHNFVLCPKGYVPKSCWIKRYALYILISIFHQFEILCFIPLYAFLCQWNMFLSNSDQLDDILSHSHEGYLLSDDLTPFMFKITIWAHILTHVTLGISWLIWVLTAFFSHVLILVPSVIEFKMFDSLPIPVSIIFMRFVLL